MKKVIMIVGVMLLGCSVEEVKPKSKIFYMIDPSAFEYVLDFQKDIESIGLALENDNISFSVILGELPSGVAGIAIGMFNEYCVNIILDEEIWRLLDRSERKALVYHELAHDVFELHHGTCDIMNGNLRGITDDMIRELLDTLAKHQNK